MSKNGQRARYNNSAACAAELLLLRVAISLDTHEALNFKFLTRTDILTIF